MAKPSEKVQEMVVETQDEIKKIMAKYSREYKTIPVKELYPNPWNPNVQKDSTFRSVKASIERFGFLNPITVRSYVPAYQIIDGEHRMRAAVELGFTELPCIVLGNEEVEVTNADAMTLTKLLNTSGAHDAVKEGKLFEEIKKLDQGNLGLFEETDKEIINKIALINFDFSKYEKEEKIDENRVRTLAFALTPEEYEIVSHALQLTKKDHSHGLILIIKEYLTLREDISRWEGKKKELDPVPEQVAKPQEIGDDDVEVISQILLDPEVEDSLFEKLGKEADTSTMVTLE